MSRVSIDLTALYRNACCRPCGFMSCAVLLASGTLVFCSLLFPLVFWLQGWQGMADAVTAALICLISGMTSLAVSTLPLSRQQPFVGLLLAMALRMLPPLVVCLVLAQHGSGAEYLSFVCYLILFYLLTLAAETLLSLRLLKFSLTND